DIAEKKSKSRIYWHQLESRSHASTRLTSLSNYYHNHMTRHHKEYTKASGDRKLQKKLRQELNQFTRQFP
ncbi:21373_t:CDS:1, partial [Rhizophagus irregularis]